MPNGRRWLIIGLLVVGAALAAGWPLVDVLFREEATETFEIDQEVRTVEAGTRVGRVDLVVGDEIAVVAEQRWSLREPDPVVEVDDGVLRVEDGCPLGGWPFGSCQVTVTVTVPADVAARITTTNGAISFDGRTGEVEARSTNGRIEATELGATAVAARTTNGDVELAFVAAPEAVDARTTNGGIEIVVPDDTYDVEASTTNGRVRVDVVDDPEARRRIEAGTVNGPVVITTP